MSYLFRVSKPTYDVLTTQDPEKLIFSSDYNSFKYYVSGEAYLDIDSGAPHASTTVNHNLGYIPFFVVYVMFSTGPYANKWLLCPFGDPNFVYAQAYATTSVIGFRLDESAYVNTASATFNYKIFKNNTGL